MAWYGMAWHGTAWHGTQPPKAYYNCEYFEDDYAGYGYDDDYFAYCESQQKEVNVSNITGIVAVAIIVINVIGGVLVSRSRKAAATAKENRISIASDMGLDNSTDEDDEDDSDDDDAVGLLDAQPINSRAQQGGYNNPNGEYDDSPAVTGNFTEA